MQACVVTGIHTRVASIGGGVYQRCSHRAIRIVEKPARPNENGFWYQGCMACRTPFKAGMCANWLGWVFATMSA